jgi:hypothetical protein
MHAIVQTIAKGYLGLGCHTSFASLDGVNRFRAWWRSSWGSVDRRVRLGKLVGLVFIVAGFAVIGKAWDGAANINFATGQLPYLLSGGFAGLGLIVTGASMLIVSANRAERQVLSERFDQMTQLLGRNLSRLRTSTNGPGPTVIASGGSYHRLGCSVLEGKSDLDTITVGQAVAEGLSACRICDPEKPEQRATEARETPAP